MPARRFVYDRFRIAEHLATARTGVSKERAMAIWDYTYKAWAWKHFNWWYRRATHSQPPLTVGKAQMLQTHLPNILTHLNLEIPKPLVQA
jgi:hypothetical protein